MKLGILDYCWQVEGQSSTARLAETIELAKRGEEWGYSRFWLPEHHGRPGTAHAAPEMITAAIAAHTRSIRVGPAGILLRFYSPFKVAEVFRCLEALYPNRIDLGLGRGGDNLVGAAMLDGNLSPAAQAYDRKACDVVGMLRDDLPEGHAFRQARAMPADVKEPQVWVLGSGESSAPLAASLGVSFAFGLLLGNKEEEGKRAVADYRRAFRRSASTPTPRCVIALAGVCAETEQEAARLRAQHNNAFITPTVVGTPRQVREELERVAEAFETDDIVFAQLGSEDAARAKGYELLARECGIAPKSPARPPRAASRARA